MSDDCVMLVAGVKINLPNNKVYVLKEGDTWFSIGDGECGDPRMGYEIARLNENNRELIAASNRWKAARSHCPYCTAPTDPHTRKYTGN